ncbi:MAG TPA: DUF4199 domain-containing protein [Ignavibacteria bacterium]|nr:DUF4199 domain-containing protein [Ignavibacteria bacterium]
MKKAALTFGLIGGVLVIIYSAILFMTFGDFGNMPLDKLGILEVMGYLNYLILILAIFFAMRAQKKEWSESGQSMKYMSIVKVGLMVSFIVALFVGIGEFIYISINPEFFNQYGDLMVRKLEAGGASAQEITDLRQSMEDFKWMQNPIGSGVFYFFESFVIGAVIAFIFGIFLRPKNKVSMAQA